MYENNHFQTKSIIKFLFVFCFLNCPAFSKPVSKNLSILKTETGNLTNTAPKQEEVQAEISSSTEENVLHSVWKISNSSSEGTAFPIGSNRMFTNFHVLSGLLENGGSLEDIVLTQSVSSSEIKIQKVLKVSALYDLVLFETKETVPNYLELTDDLLDPEEELSIVGYPKGVLTTIQKTGNLYQADSFSYFPVNTINLPGTSGSPVLNTQGEVVGVAFYAIYNLLFFTKVSDIQKFLSEKELNLCSFFLYPVKCLEEEITNLREMAEQGSALAQFTLAEMYEEGLVTEVNEKLAFYWGKKATEQGSDHAQFRLAKMYLKGIGTEVNDKLAFYWYKKASEQGFAPAQDMLAKMYLRGIGTEVNEKLTFYWSKKAAEQSYDPAQILMAYVYELGFGTEVNEKLAFYWHKKVAEQGYDHAQSRLSYMYREGIGTKVNIDLAFYWYNKLAEQGLAPPQNRLDYINEFRKQFKYYQLERL